MDLRVYFVQGSPIKWEEMKLRDRVVFEPEVD